MSYEIIFFTKEDKEAVENEFENLGFNHDSGDLL